MTDTQNTELISNRKAFHDYEILNTYEAGVVLKGTEVKSLRDHGGSLQEAYIKVTDNELWLVGCNIAHWKYGNIYNHEEKRDRKLLMHKTEITRLKTASQIKGYTLIPLAMYFKKGRIKVKIATARGKTNVDKRHAIKEREEKRHMSQMMKKYS